ncbi:MAG: cobalamin biosynthesis protein [Actinomycetota bacterium]|nr:cobalamin biosynthesis protein [Actinomycetota bacterium]
MVDVILLSKAGREVAQRLMDEMPELRLHAHKVADLGSQGAVFESLLQLVADIFIESSGIIFIGPCGAIVRAIAPHLKGKLCDPTVVVVDVKARYAISLVGAHEGGGNDLALSVSNIINAEPVVTTTSEAVKSLIVGVGCRRGSTRDSIMAAVDLALSRIRAEISDVRILATVDIKKDEQGLKEAAAQLKVPLRFISSDEIRESFFNFDITPLAKDRVHLPAVAEPAALLGGRRTRLILQKIKLDGVTVAIAKENSL